MEKRIKLSLDDMIRKFKDKKIAVLIFAVFIGIILMSFSSLSFSNDAEISSSSNKSQVENDIEDKLENLISKISGVGELSLMVTYENSGTAEYVTDGTQSTEKIENSSGATNKSSIDSSVVVDGSKEPVLKFFSSPKVKGVVIVCDGGNDPVTKERVINAVSTVLQIGTDKIYVTQTQRKRGEQ